jgi:hypothetical protein
VPFASCIARTGALFVCHYRLWAEPLPVIEDNLHGLPRFQADGTLFEVIGQQRKVAGHNGAGTQIARKAARPIILLKLKFALLCRLRRS